MAHQLENPGASDAKWVYTSRTVRQVYRNTAKYPEGLECDYLRVETQSPTNPGDSGGPVVNKAGEIIAINHATGGGWRSLSERFHSDRPLQGRVATYQTVQVGAVVYKRCVAIGVADDGLCMKIWRKTAFISWQDITGVQSSSLIWQTVPQLVVGQSRIAAVAIPQQLFEQLKGYLESATWQTADPRQAAPART